MWADTILAFILMLSPIYLLTNSKIIAFILILLAIVWPDHSQNDFLMRIIMIADGIYMATTSVRASKYKMIPSKIKNSDFPIHL
jgi:hypothetical protein